VVRGARATGGSRAAGGARIWRCSCYDGRAHAAATDPAKAIGAAACTGGHGHCAQAVASLPSPVPPFTFTNTDQTRRSSDPTRRCSDPAVLVLRWRWIRQGQQGGGARPRSTPSLGCGFSLFCFLFDLPRQAFELPWERPIYYDLWTEAVVMPASVKPFSPPQLNLCSSELVGVRVRGALPRVWSSLQESDIALVSVLEDFPHFNRVLSMQVLFQILLL
jgi:hypothetical protein